MTNSPSTRVSVVAAATVLAGAISAVCFPLTAGLAGSVLMLSAAALVAFVAQSGRFGEDERLAYRPVYARRRIVQRRVTSQDD